MKSRGKQLRLIIDRDRLVERSLGSNQARTLRPKHHGSNVVDISDLLNELDFMGGKYLGGDLALLIIGGFGQVWFNF
jgi:hypothetical protein